MGFFDFVDDGLNYLGLKDEANDFGNAFKGFTEPISQAIGNIANGGLAATLGEDFGQGFGQIGEEMQNWNPQQYFGEEQGWQPWKFGPDALNYIDAPFEYYAREISPDILGSGLATLKGDTVSQENLSGYWDEQATENLPGEGFFLKGLAEEAVNPLNWIPLQKLAKIPAAGKYLGPAGKLIDDVMGAPITVPLNLAGKALNAAGITKLSKTGSAMHELALATKALSEAQGSKLTMDDLQKFVTQGIDMPLSQQGKEYITGAKDIISKAITETSQRNKPLIDLVHYIEQTNPQLAQQLRQAPNLGEVFNLAGNINDPKIGNLLTKAAATVGNETRNYLSTPFDSISDNIYKQIRLKHGLKAEGGTSWLNKVPNILKQAWLGANPAYHLQNAMDDNLKLILSGVNPLSGTRDIDNIIKYLGYDDIGKLGTSGMVGQIGLTRGGLEDIPLWGGIQKKAREFGEWRETLTRKTAFAHKMLADYKQVTPKFLSNVEAKLSTVTTPDVVRSIMSDIRSKHDGFFSPKDIRDLVEKYASPTVQLSNPYPDWGLRFGGDTLSTVNDAINMLNPADPQYANNIQDIVDRAKRELRDYADNQSLFQLNKAHTINDRIGAMSLENQKQWTQLTSMLKNVHNPNLIKDVANVMRAAMRKEYDLNAAYRTQYGVMRQQGRDGFIPVINNFLDTRENIIAAQQGLYKLFDTVPNAPVSAFQKSQINLNVRRIEDAVADAGHRIDKVRRDYGAGILTPDEYINNLDIEFVRRNDILADIYDDIIAINPAAPSGPGVGNYDTELMDRMDGPNGLNPYRNKVEQNYTDTLNGLDTWMQDILNNVGQHRQLVQQNSQSLGPIRNILREASEEWATTVRTVVDSSQKFTYDKLFNYAEPTHLDEFLHMFSPFTVWQTRNIPTYLRILAQNPNLFRAMNLYKDESERQQEGQNMSQRFENMVQVPGQKDWWVNPTGAISVAGQFNDPFAMEGATDLGKGVSTAQKLAGGLGLWPWLQIPMNLSGQLGQMPFSQQLPQTRMIQGLTGTNIEQPIQQGLEKLRSNITGVEPPLTESTFLDSAINRRLSEWVAEGKVTRAQAERAMDNQKDSLWLDAEKQVRGETDKSTLARALQPFPIKYQGEGEATIRKLQGELKAKFGGRSYDKLTKQEQNEYNAFKNQHPEMRAYDSAYKDPVVRELQMQSDEFYNIAPQWLLDASSDYSSRDKDGKLQWRKEHPQEYKMLQTELWDKRDKYLETHPDLSKFMNWDRSKNGEGSITTYIEAKQEYAKVPESRQWREENPESAPAPVKYEPTIAKPKAPTEEQVTWNTYWYIKNTQKNPELAAMYLKYNRDKVKLKY